MPTLLCLQVLDHLPTGREFPRPRGYAREVERVRLATTKRCQVGFPSESQTVLSADVRLAGGRRPRASG